MNAGEIAELDRQNPATKNRGGFQSMLVGFQLGLDRSSGRLTLSDRDLEQIARYAFDYQNGGWQRRLKRIFERTLGPELGRVCPAA
jgi:hypothetical protein